MADVILVLNAGSSSLKFSAFDAQTPRLDLVLHGQVEALYTSPRLWATGRDSDVDTEEWGTDYQLGHLGAIEYLARFLRSHGEGHRLIAVGHRVVHGGQRFSRAVMATPDVTDELERLSPLAPLHQPHNLKPIRIIAQLHPEFRKLPASTPCFTTRRRKPRRHTHCLHRLRSGACAGTDFT